MELSESIISSTIEIFESMLMMDAKAGDPLDEEVKTFRCSVSGIVGLAGTHKGMLSIHIPETVAMAITASFIGMDVDEINEDVKDAIGELANMLAGSIKSALSENGKDIQISIPSAIHGQEYSIECLAESDWVIVPFQIPPGEFLVELQLKST